MEQTCPIWGTSATVTVEKADPFLWVVESERAGGKYEVSSTIADGVLKNIDNSIKLRLTTWLVHQHQCGTLCPVVSESIVRAAQTWPPLSVGDRADRTLKFIADKTGILGQRVDLSTLYSQMLPLTESLQNEERAFLKNYLLQIGWIQLPIAELYHSVVISIEGYAHLDELLHFGAASSQAFIAMWFDPSMTESYENGLAAGVRDAGYDPYRVDRSHYNDKIDDKIITEIRRSRFLVADFTCGSTGVRGGVYYEAGFAHGLKIPVIFTCRSDVIGDVHFDTRQYNHITWETPVDLRDKLNSRITATLGDGPLRLR
jgi:hypothetical protein